MILRDDSRADQVPPPARGILDGAWKVLGWCYFGVGVFGHLVMLCPLLLDLWIKPHSLIVLPLTTWTALTWLGVRMYRAARLRGAVPGAVVVLCF